MREPSIHITRSNLKRIIAKVARETGTKVGCPMDDLVDSIMRLSKVSALSSRNILVDSKKLASKVSKITQAEMEPTVMFAKYLKLIREQNHHRGISLIKEGSREWTTLKEVTRLAISFCDDFNLTRPEGFKEYISIALTKMGKFSLARFNSIHPVICEVYEATQSLKEAGDSSLAKDMHSYYRQKIIDRVGEAIDYNKFPEKYIHFIKASELCKKKGISYRDYIDAQFFGLDWAGGIPEPQHITGIKAEERLQKYMFKHGIRANVENKPKVDWSKIKKAHDNH